MAPWWFLHHTLVRRPSPLGISRMLGRLWFLVMWALTSRRAVVAFHGRTAFFSGRSLSILMSAVDDDVKTIESTWNLTGLKREVSRQSLRCHKKVSKARQRLTAAKEQVEELTTNPDVTMEQLEQCPDVDTLEVELTDLKERLSQLQQLEEALASEKNGKRVLPEATAELALALGVADEPPQKQPRGPGKPKGPRESSKSRLPYRRFYSVDQTEIRVGKQADDNDELTLRLRDDMDWWMHAAGCPGSHVVIRNTSNNLPEEIVQDAAALAARQSKCQGKVIKVSLTRCRDIRKPAGAKAGLVQLVGNVRTISVNMKEAEARLQRLDDTCLVN